MLRFWAGILAGTLLLAACGGDDDQPGGGAPTAPSTTISPGLSASPQATTGTAANTLVKASILDVAGAKDFAGIPRYPDSWIVGEPVQPRETANSCGRTWNKYDIHYQSAETDNAKIVNYLTEKLTSLGWTPGNEKNESGSIATSFLTKDKLDCVPAGTAYLQGIAIVARSAIDNTIVFTLTVPAGRDPFAQ